MTAAFSQSPPQLIMVSPTYINFTMFPISLLSWLPAHPEFRWGDILRSFFSSLHSKVTLSEVKIKKTLFYPQHSPTQAHYGNRLLAGSTSADDAPRPYHVLAFFRLYPQKNLQRMPFRIVVLTTNLAKNSSMTSLNLCCLSLSILDRQSAWLRKPQVVICLTIEHWSRLPVSHILKYCQTQKH